MRHPSPAKSPRNHKILIYGYASGVFSSRKVARKLHEDVAFRMLCANNYPAHRTIREFRQLHLEEFSALFVQVVKLAREAGLVSLGRVGVDGTKIKANASKHKAMSYARMQDEEARLKREIAGLLKQAEAQDQADEDRDGPEDRNGGLPQELKRHEDRLKVIEQAKARLEERRRQCCCRWLINSSAIPGRDRGCSSLIRTTPQTLALRTLRTWGLQPMWRLVKKEAGEIDLLMPPECLLWRAWRSACARQKELLTIGGAR